MHGTASARGIHPLCYEHHSEMTLRKLASSHDGMAYACQEPDCFVRYSGSDGYFLNTQDHVLIEQCRIPPHQYCSNDRYPMYLFEVRMEHPRFRLWRCPKCGMNIGGGQI
jgi:hypothetical protein